MLKLLSRIVIWTVAGVFGVAVVAGALYAMWQAALAIVLPGHNPRSNEDFVVMLMGLVLWAYCFGKLLPLIGDWVVWAFKKDDK